MIRRLSFIAALVSAPALAAACPSLDGARPLAATAEEAPKAFISVGDLPLSAPFEMQVEFCGGPDTPIRAMTFDAVMPAHQHGMNYTVQVSRADDQTYRVENIVFHMPGRWEMRIDAAAGDQKFAYTGEVMVE